MAAQVNTRTFPGPLLPPFKIAGFFDYRGRTAGDEHQHDCFQIVFVQSGRLQFTRAGDETLQVNRGEVALIPPGLRHTWSAPLPVLTRTFMFLVAPLNWREHGELAAFFPAEALPAWWKLRLPAQKVCRLFRELRGLRATPKLAAAAKLSGHLLICLAELAQATQAIGASVQSMPQPVQQAVGFMRNNLFRPIALRQLAEQSGLGTSRFSQLFRQHFGTSPMHYLNQLRIQQAQVLLAYSPLPVKEIARQTGFQSVHYFTRAFKRASGLAPAEFRTRRSQ